MRRHYHVTAGLPGCLPDSNDYYPTLRAARSGLTWTLRTWQEAYPHGRATEGSQRAGYYLFDRDARDDVSPYTVSIIIELSPCFENCDPEACI